MLSKMKSAYPRFHSLFSLISHAMLIPDRFFVDNKIRALEQALLKDLGCDEERAMLFPSIAIASRCIHFMARGSVSTASTRSSEVTTTANLLAQSPKIQLIDLVFRTDDPTEDVEHNRSLASAVIFPKEFAEAAKAFWQHSGDGISSRRAEFCHALYRNGHLEAQVVTAVNGPTPLTAQGGRGPRRYQKGDASAKNENVLASLGARESCSSLLSDHRDFIQYIEERYGRNLTLQQAENAKLAIRRRLAGSLVDDLDLAEAIAISHDSNPTRKVNGFTEDDVYLYPSGMSSIFNTHQTLLAARGFLKSVSFG